MKSDKISDLRQALEEARERGKRTVYFVKKQDGRYLKCDEQSGATHFVTGHYGESNIKDINELPENPIFKTWKGLDEFWDESNARIAKMQKEFAERERAMRPSWETMHRPFDL